MSEVAGILEVVTQLAPTLMKYAEIEPKYINIEVNQIGAETNIKIHSDRHEIGKGLAELMLMVAKISEANPNTKVEVKVNGL